MSDPDREPTEKPTHDREEAEQEGQWMARNWLGIAVVSILGLLLVVIAMMQATGTMDVLAPIAETETQQWAVLGALVLAWLALAGWSWNGIAS